jgi:DNA polymerase III subunit beta
MNFSVTKDNLQRGLQIVSHISNKQVNLPVLQNVHIKADGGGIVLSTTNLELATRVRVRGKIDKDGEFTVPAKLCNDFVALLPNDRVDISLADTVLEVSCGETSTNMNGIDASEFPLIPSVETTASIQLPAEELKEALSQVLFSASLSEARPELSGILIRFEDEKVTLAATDSYRLSERTLPIEGMKKFKEVIIPGRALNEVIRIISTMKDDPDSGDTISMNLSENQAVFAYGPAELTTRVIDGTYPDYTQIIPTQFKTEVVVGRQELIKAVKTASLFSRSGIFDVSLSVSIDDGKVVVEATEVTRGKNSASCPAEAKGIDNQITVNFQYLLAGLNAMKSEGITIKLIDAMNPCLIQPNGTSDKGVYTYLVMPIRQ